jgi:hypothetical protein
MFACGLYLEANAASVVKRIRGTDHPFMVCGQLLQPHVGNKSLAI